MKILKTGIFLSASLIALAIASHWSKKNSDSERVPPGNSIYSADQREFGFSSCLDQFPSNLPISNDLYDPSMNPIQLCSNNFAVLYSATSKTPLVVIEKLNRDRIIKARSIKRSNEFFADPRLKRSQRSELEDYRGLNQIDRGHNQPAADSPDEISMVQSFSLSNIFPQNSALNRGEWQKLEKNTRQYAMRSNGNVSVFTGPIFYPGFSKVGKNSVWVPSAIFKLVYDETTKKAWAHILPNSETAQLGAPISYNDFVSTTGLKLLSGQKVEN